MSSAPWSLHCGLYGLTLLLSGCAATSSYDRDYVSTELYSRTGNNVAQRSDTRFSLPEGVRLSNELSEEDAVAIALWNNASWQASLAELGIARADLASAGAIPNPVLSLLFPASPAIYEATLSLPIDLLSRHSRVNAAKEEVTRTAALLVAQGLDLARDVRITHAESLVAKTQYELLQELAALSADIISIADVQLETGRISEQTYAAQQSQRAEFSLLAIKARQAALVQQYRLQELLGLDEPAIAKGLQLKSSNVPKLEMPELQALLDIALKSRPELQAAEAAVQRAGYQAKWERNRLLSFIATLKQEKSDTDTSNSPGVQFEVPLFDQNQGGRSRATAELQRAAQTMLATQHAVRREVSEARAAYLTALETESLLNDVIMPALKDEFDLSRQAHGFGKQSYLQVMLVQLRYLQAQLRAADSQLALQRAAAQLAHSLGQQLQQPLASSAARAP
ncbi:MAG: TolC family protein [Steroidobacteraceae bacterium]